MHVAYMSSLVYAHGDIDVVIKAISTEIEQAPTLELFLMRARLHLAHDDTEAALADCDRAQNLAGASKDAHAAVDQCRGKILLAAQRPGEAQHALQRSMQAQPGNGETYELYAQALTALRQDAAALAALEKREGLSPLPRPQFYLDRLALQRQTEASTMVQMLGLEQGMKRLGSLLILEQAALDVELKAHAYIAAQTRLNRLISHANRPEKWLVQLGDLQRAVGQAEAAARSYQAALIAVSKLPDSRRQTPATQEVAKIAQAHLTSLSFTHKN